MKELIQKPGSELAIVIYDAPLPPRYFRFSKKFLRTLTVVIPVLLVLTFYALFFWGLKNRVAVTPKPVYTSPVASENTALKALEEEVRTLRESNNLLTDKLAGQASIQGPEDVFLMGIKKPYGMQNLTSKNSVALGQLELLQDANKTNLKFQIMSTNPEKRVMGHVMVFMISESGIIVYPKEANSDLDKGIKYSIGEPFAVSRIRPTNAEFNHRLTGDSVRFKIYIFSREGDLLLVQESQPFKVGPKQ